MKSLKVLLVLCLFPLFSFAKLNTGFGTGAYLGRQQLQLSWTSETDKHYVTGVFGYTKDPDLTEIRQYSAVYLWNPYTKDYEILKWSPFLVGTFITYTDHSKYYFNSPSRYEDADYYDVSNTRWGFRFATEVLFVKNLDNKIRLLLEGSFLDNGLNAFYNNSSEFEILKNFWSVGVSVRVDL